MTREITAAERKKMQNPVIQFFKFIFLSIKVLIIVAGGHGGTRS